MGGVIKSSFDSRILTAKLVTEQTVNNSVALVEVPEMQITLPDGAGRYWFSYHLFCQANILGSFRFRSYPNGTCSGTMLVSSYQNRGIAALGGDAVVNSNTTVELITIQGCCNMGGDPGTMKLYYAQQFAHASDAKLYPGSSLMMVKL